MEGIDEVDFVGERVEIKNKRNIVYSHRFERNKYMYTEEQIKDQRLFSLISGTGQRNNHLKTVLWDGVSATSLLEKKRLTVSRQLS